MKATHSNSDRIRSAASHMCRMLLLLHTLHIHIIIRYSAHQLRVYTRHDKPNWISKSAIRHRMRNALSRDEATTPAPLEDKLKQCSKSKTYAIRRSKKIYLSSYRIEIVPNFFSKFKPSSSTLPSFPFALLFCANKFVANGCRVWHTAYSVHLFAFVCVVLSSFIRFLRMYRLKYLWRCQCLPSAKRTSGHVRADIVGQPTTDNSFRFSQRIPEIRVHVHSSDQNWIAICVDMCLPRVPRTTYCSTVVQRNDSN